MLSEIVGHDFVLYLTKYLTCTGREWHVTETVLNRAHNWTWKPNNRVMQTMHSVSNPLADIGETGLVKISEKGNCGCNFHSFEIPTEHSTFHKLMTRCNLTRHFCRSFPPHIEPMDPFMERMTRLSNRNLWKAAGIMQLATGLEPQMSWLTK